MADFVFVGTEWFWDYYDKTSPSDKLQSIMNWCGETWANQIDNSNGDYPFSPHIEDGDNKTVIPSSALPSGSSVGLGERMADADDWLVNNTTMNSWADVFVVADHYGYDDNTYGVGYTGTAGSDNDITGLVDCSWEDHNDLPSELSLVQSEGVAYHEMCHVFSASHPDHVGTNSNDYVSLMYSWDGSGCFDYGSPDLVERSNTTCAISSVRDYYDSNRFDF
jgi:hypothetical protein